MCPTQMPSGLVENCLDIHFSGLQSLKQLSQWDSLSKTNYSDHALLQIAAYVKVALLEPQQAIWSPLWKTVSEAVITVGIKTNYSDHALLLVAAYVIVTLL